MEEERRSDKENAKLTETQQNARSAEIMWTAVPPDDRREEKQETRETAGIVWTAVPPDEHRDEESALVSKKEYTWRAMCQLV